MSYSTITRLFLFVVLSAVTGQVEAKGFWHALKNWVDSADIIRPICICPRKGL